MTEIIRITAGVAWQMAGVYYVRTEGMVKGFGVPIELEFEDDGPASLYILLLEDGLPVATCRPRILDADTAKIERVCVTEAFRGRDFGKQAILAAEQWLKESGVRKIIINSRDKVTGFYEKLGYTADWNRIHQGFFPEVHMEKQL
ncbi:MAG: GNAT family N-acetyltransferase [Tannerella sp.]|nr:GNAT family N-acetyltransferase [Tannerella sp.]